MGDRSGAEGGLATAASGYPEFSAAAGRPGAIVQANIDNSSPPNARLGQMLPVRIVIIWASRAPARKVRRPRLPWHQRTLRRSLPVLMWSARMRKRCSLDAARKLVRRVGVERINFMRAFLGDTVAGADAWLVRNAALVCPSHGPWRNHRYGTRLTMNITARFTRTRPTSFMRAIYISLIGRSELLRMDPVRAPGAFERAGLPAVA